MSQQIQIELVEREKKNSRARADFRGMSRRNGIWNSIVLKHREGSVRFANVETKFRRARATGFKMARCRARHIGWCSIRRKYPRTQSVHLWIVIVDAEDDTSPVNRAHSSSGNSRHDKTNVAGRIYAQLQRTSCTKISRLVNLQYFFRARARAVISAAWWLHGTVRNFDAANFTF